MSAKKGDSFPFDEIPVSSAKFVLFRMEGISDKNLIPSALVSCLRPFTFRDIDSE